MNNIEILIILCTAALAVSFYAGCSKIAGAISAFTINIVKDPKDDTEPMSDKPRQ